MLLQPEKVRIIIKCCIHLPHFLRKSRLCQVLYTPPGTFDSLTEKDDKMELVEGSWRKDSESSISFLSLRNIARKSCDTAKGIRE